jgi:AbrB family looped-hinge helix DNA binding protein
METVILNEKGQVTIPARIRKDRGLSKGTRIAIVEIGERIELVPIPEDIVQALIGLGDQLPSLEEIEAEADRE